VWQPSDAARSAKLTKAGFMTAADQRLIEDYIPIEAISAEARREKSIRKGHISTLHLWWARRPLVAARAAVYGALTPAPADKKQAKQAADFVTDLCKYPGSPSVIAEARRHLLEAHAERLTAERVGAGLAPAQAIVTAEDIEAGRAPRPRVLDMFAGGGAIPLEALRLGCEAYALDLNPVAHLIQLCTLVYPQQYGAADPAAHGCADPSTGSGGTWAGLAAEVEHWGKWVLKQVKAEIGDLYPPIPDPTAAPAGEGAGQLGMDWVAPASAGEHGAGMLTPVAYLWTRTVRCKNPACGGIVPLARQTWLAQKEDRYVALEFNAEINRQEQTEKKRVVYRVVEAPDSGALGFDPAAGSKAGNATCPFCGTVAGSDHVKAEGQLNRIGVQALAVACIRHGAQGKVYLDVEHAPSRSWPSDHEVWQRIDTLNEETTINGSEPLMPPDEAIVTDSKGSAWVTQYGLKRFRDLFTPRQMLALLTFAKWVRAAEVEMRQAGYQDNHAQATVTLLGINLSRLSNFCSSLCTWRNDGGRGINHVFARQALPMVWDFAETNPLNEIAASWPSCLREVVNVTRMLASYDCQAATVVRGSATNPPFLDEFFDAVITDPPYYDNVAYADLSDFFYVWLKRCLTNLHPEHLSSSLTPKKAEAVADATRHDGDRARAAKIYEETMQRAFSHASRVLRPGGPLVVVYAHKTTLGWATLVEALRSAGFAVTEAWPLDTENESRIRAADTASLASSIFLIARRRESNETGSYERDVRPDLERIVRERVDRLWAQGVTGADLVIACVGAGLAAFTRFAAVEYANGAPVPADTFLAEVEGAVLETLLERLFGISRAGFSRVDPATRFYVLWRYAYRQAAIDAGEAIVFAYPQRVELDGANGLAGGANPLVEKSGSKYRLRDFAERGDDEKLGLPKDGRSATLVDVLHRVLWLVEHRPALIPAYLDEARPDLEHLRVVAQTLAGQTLSGAADGGRGLVAARGAEAAALRKLTTNWRSLIETERRGIG
jgi:putative DNA methylase